MRSRIQTGRAAAPRAARRRSPRAIGFVVLALGLSSATAAQDAEWTPLLDETSIHSWIRAGASEASFRMADGVVTGQPIGNDPENAFLCSPREFRDFELAFAFRIAPRSLNSGVQFRSEVRADGIVAGPQLEMEVEDPATIGFLRSWVFPVLVRLTSNPWRPRYWAAAGVYGESLEFGWIYPGVAGGDPEAFQAQGERLTRPTDWNELRLDASGPRVRTWLNGEARADYEHPPTDRPGLICLQVHGGHYEDPSAYRIEWKDLRIRESPGLTGSGAGSR